jgi:site-specific DNA recombinase
VKKGSIKPVRCAIYTRVSTDHGLEQDFNSLDAQHDAAQAYIRSQAHAGWTLIRSRYDDGGYSGAFAMTGTHWSGPNTDPLSA